MRFNKFLLGIATLSVLSSCDNSGIDGNGGLVDGIPVSATLNISLGMNTATRASGKTTEEGKVHNVKIFVYSSKTLEQVLIADVESGNTSASKVINTTSGRKEFVVLANTLKTEESVINGLSNVGVSKLDDMNAFLRATDKKAASIAPETTPDIALAAASYVMSKIQEQEITKEENQTIAIALNRSSVKVATALNPAKVELLPQWTITNGDGDISYAKMIKAVAEPKFTLVQTAMQSHVVRTAAYTNGGSEGTQVDLEANKDPRELGTGTFDHLHPYNKDDQFYRDALPVFPAAAASIAWGEALYCGENVNQKTGAGKITTGEITFSIVRVKLEPTDNKGQALVLTDGTFTLETKSATGEIVQIHAGKVTTATAGGDKLITYEGGLAYYRLDLRDKTQSDIEAKYAVKANSLYSVQVNRILGFGSNNPEDLIPVDPETPTETDVDITANITVSDWFNIDMTEDLE